MSAVELLKTASGRLCGYRVSGHTGFAGAGKDIVCSALSFLSITCANALESVAGQKPAIRIDEQKGFLSVILAEEQLTGQTDTIFRVFEQGVHDLAAAYPRYIEQSDSKWRKTSC